jgi:hypothetical protein
VSEHPDHHAEPGDDDLHEPTTDDPWWTETCWFTFTVPERRLSAQLYPYFMKNLGVMAAGAYVWDDTGTTPADCRYAKNLWHLPIPDQPLGDMQIANGSWYRLLEPGRWALGYDDPDGDELHIDVTFTAVTDPHRLGESHIDQPGRFEGTIVLHGETIEVDAYGFRDRSWGPRIQLGSPHIQGSGASHGGYSYATASPEHAFHSITMDWGTGCTNLHGYLLRDGEWSKLTSGERRVVERDADGFPVVVHLEGRDDAGRLLEAEGRTHNRLAFWINPNLYTLNCLTEWSFDGTTAWGEDHDNHSSAGARALFRGFEGAR